MKAYVPDHISDRGLEDLDLCRRRVEIELVAYFHVLQRLRDDGMKISAAEIDKLLKAQRKLDVLLGIFPV